MARRGTRTSKCIHNFKNRSDFETDSREFFFGRHSQRRNIFNVIVQKHLPSARCVDPDQELEQRLCECLSGGGWTESNSRRGGCRRCSIDGHISDLDPLCGLFDACGSMSDINKAENGVRRRTARRTEGCSQ